MRSHAGRTAARWAAWPAIIGLLLNLGMSVHSQERGVGGVVVDGTWVQQSDLANIGDYYALIIGIDQYAPAEWKLRCAVNDAKAVARVLREDYGFREIVELYDKEATVYRIKAELMKLRERVAEKDSVLIYYAGHGTLDRDTGYWIPVDGRPGEQWTYLEHILIRNYVRKRQLPARHVLVVTDSCYAGALFRSARLPAKATPTYVREALRTPSRQCLASGGLYPVPAGPTGGHSVFAEYFLKLLKNPPRDAFVPSDIMPKLKANVSHNAPPVRGQPQVPILGDLTQSGGEVGGEFVFLFRRTAPEPVEVAKVPDLSAWEREQTELKRRRQEYERRKAAQEAQRRLLEAAKKAYGVAKQCDEAAFHGPKEKATKWQDYLRHFESSGYEVAYAKERLAHWRAYRPPAVRVEAPSAPKGKTWTNPKDGSEMILIPAGPFKMGSDKDSDEKPIHEVNVSSLYISKHEITNRQWQKFVDANPRWQKGKADSKLVESDYLNEWNDNSYPSDKADHPVTYVSWFAAKAYCEWAGGRLPAEAEWEKAARGTDGRVYPWGNDWDEGKCNVGSGTKLVGSYPLGASPFGVLDMAGNVWEWTNSIYKPYPYKANDGREDPNDAGSRRVSRGGGWCYVLFVSRYCRSTFRGLDTPANCLFYLGVRFCVAGGAPR